MCYEIPILTFCIYTVKDEHDVIRRKRTFGSTDPPCNGKYASFYTFYIKRVINIRPFVSCMPLCLCVNTSSRMSISSSSLIFISKYLYRTSFRASSKVFRQTQFSTFVSVSLNYYPYETRPCLIEPDRGHTAL